MMKVGIDAQAAVDHYTGLSEYVTNLIKSLKLLNAGIEYKTYQDKSLIKPNTIERLYWENWLLPKLIKKDKLDILHIPAFSPPFYISDKIKLVVTVHDLIGIKHPNKRGSLSRLYWGGWLPKMILRADRIITPSEHTKKDIVNILNISEKKIRVIPISGGEDFKTNIRIKGNYFLAIGSEPRKNIKRIKKAFEKFDRKISGYRLVIIGNTNSEKGKVKTCKCVPKEILNWFYCGATALVFPSLYEGFGIPILEAMRCGTPVITAKITSTSEVSGDAAILVDPMSENEICSAMEALVTREGLADDFIHAGFNQAMKYTWLKTARETEAVYMELI